MRQSLLFPPTAIWLRWKFASKVGSWPKLLLPACLGQALGAYASQAVSGRGFILGASMTFCLTLYIVWLNDWGDQRVDHIKRQLFPDSCSPKTLPDGILAPHHLFFAGLFMVCLLALLTISGSFLLERDRLLFFALVSLLTFQAYTFAPLKLNYRGGGELLEMLGIGLLLPWLNAYCQAGIFWHPLYALFFGCCCLSFASALASGLADEESDLIGGKTTFTTVFGNKAARAGVAFSLLLAPCLWLESRGQLPLAAFIPAIIALLYFGVRMQAVSHLALTRAFAAQKIYKAYLHRAMWWSLGLLTASLVVLLVIELWSHGR